MPFLFLVFSKQTTGRQEFPPELEDQDDANPSPRGSVVKRAVKGNSKMPGEVARAVMQCFATQARADGRIFGVKRLRRMAFNVVSAASALLSLAAAMLWVRSYYHTDGVIQERRWFYPEIAALNATVQEGILLPDDEGEFSEAICSHRGSIVWRHAFSQDVDRSPPPCEVTWWMTPPVGTANLNKDLGAQLIQQISSAHYAPRFGIDSNVGVRWGELRTQWYDGTLWILVEYWLPTIIFASMPAIWITRRILTPRHVAGSCKQCGYDLRATPHKCPECGTIPSDR